VGLPSLTDLTVAVGIGAIGLGVTVAAVRGLLARRRDLRWGSLVAIDAGAPAVLRSSRYRLSGRPDVLRRLPDGRVVPVELKSRATPRRGPSRSHQAQVAAYCLLVEEATGVAPPFGVLRYSDGREFRVPWGPGPRHALLALRFAIDRPYEGEATPSPAKCAGCAWRSVCDARAPGT
jgi:CRISPR-associated exonuclease Cas4